MKIYVETNECGEIIGNKFSKKRKTKMDAEFERVDKRGSGVKPKKPFEDFLVDIIKNRKAKP